MLQVQFAFGILINLPHSCVVESITQVGGTILRLLSFSIAFHVAYLKTILDGLHIRRCGVKANS